MSSFHTQQQNLESLPQIHLTPYSTDPTAVLTTPELPPNMDTISLRSLSTQAILGSDSWGRFKPQPLFISVYLSMNTTSAGSTDNIAQTFSYGVMAKEILRVVSTKDDDGKEVNFHKIEKLIYDLVKPADAWPGEYLRIVVHAPKALLRSSEGLRLEVSFHRHGRQGTEIGQQQKQKQEEKVGFWREQQFSWSVAGLRVPCIIGVNAHERLEKQDVVIAIKTSFIARHRTDTDDDEAEEDEGAWQQIQYESPELWRSLVRGVHERVQSTTFQTLEALAACVARFCLQDGTKKGEEPFPFWCVTVGIEKPSAVTFAEGAGVEITRDREWMRGQSMDEDLAPPLAPY